MMRAVGWMTAVALAMVGVVWGVATAGAESPADAAPPALRCPSNVCQTATGPVRMRLGDTAHLAVHNHSDQPVFVVIAFFDAATGDVFREGRSEGKILEPGQHTSFDFICPSDPTADIIAGLRVSFIRSPQVGGIGARWQITDGTSNTIMFSEQLPRPGPVSGTEWGRTTSQWSHNANNWNLPSAPAAWGATTPR